MSDEPFLLGYSYRAVQAINGRFLAQYRIDNQPWHTVQTRGPRNSSSTEPVGYSNRRDAEIAADIAGRKALQQVSK